MYNSSEGNEFSITQGIKEKTVSDYFELDLSFSYLHMYLRNGPHGDAFEDGCNRELLCKCASKERDIFSTVFSKCAFSSGPTV